MFLDISQKKVLVFGGGSIALRRINTLLKFKCNITVISPIYKEEFKEIKDKVNLIKRKYLYGDCEDYFIVIAATNDSNINNKIYKECKKKNIIVNIADCKEKCDFYFPAVIAQDDIVIAVNGGGINHTKVKKVSDNIRSIKNYIFGKD